MPPRIPPRMGEIIDLLPPAGQRTSYDTWKKAIRDADKHDLIQLTRTAKQLGLAVYTLEMLPDGTINLLVGRPAPQGG